MSIKRNLIVTAAAAVAGFQIAASTARAQAGTQSMPPSAGPAVTPTTMPMAKASTSPSRTTQELTAELTSTMTQLKEQLGDLHKLASPADRSAMATKAVPLVKTMLIDLDELGQAQPQAKAQLEPGKQQFRAILVALDDPQSVKTVDAEAKSADETKMLAARSTQFQARWFQAGRDAAKQSPIVDDLAALDKAHIKSETLTMTNVMLAQSAASPLVRDRLLALATDTMQNPAASAVKQQVAAMKAQQQEMEVAASKMKEMEGKPLAVTGTTVDGKPFTTADWKGKVVLIDFWATWCGPCRAELPRVKAFYSENHPKGLEMLGVSNDYSADTLKDFVAKESMPWPQLLDKSAAAEHQWNPITTGYGINGIPTMFLIDKKGVLRSVEARENMETLVPKLLAE